MYGQETYFKWREPAEATRRRDAEEAARRPRWAAPLMALVYAALLMGVWRLLRNPERPRLDAAVPLAVGGGIVFAFVLPAIVRLAPPVVWVRNSGIQVVRAISGYVMKYKDVEAAEVAGPADGSRTPLMTVRLRNGGVRQFGVAEDVAEDALYETLRRLGVAVRAPADPFCLGQSNGRRMPA